MRKQYIGQSRRSGELWLVRSNGEPINNSQPVARYGFTEGQLLERSDVVVNPKVDGYRKPSNYAASRRFNNRGAGGVICGHAVGEPDLMRDLGPWPGGWLHNFRGDMAVGIDLSKNNSPTYESTQSLRMKLLNNVQDELLDVAMVLAEMGSTAKTGANLMLRIGRSMQAIARKDRRVFERLWSGKLPTGRDGKPITGRYLDRFNRQTASMYLEWKYGIMPTIYDLQGVTAALDANVDGSLWQQPPLLVGRAVNRSEVAYKAPLMIYEPGGTTARAQATILDTTTHKARLDFKVESSKLRGLNRFGLGLTSVATVAWDKTPFTFVFNMVVPISQIIKAWGALSGVKTVGYCETWHIDRKITVPPRVPNARTHGGGSNVIKLTNDSEMIMSRVAYKQVPMPLPFIRNPVNVGNMSTVLSLFTQLRPKGY